MSLAELKAEIGRLNDADFIELAAYIGALRKVRGPEWLARVARINADMDAGHELTKQSCSVCIRLLDPDA
jgi:hypothetical protein